MKKKVTKFLSLFLTIMLVSELFTGFDLVSGAVGDMLFVDTFDEQISSLWKVSSASNVALSVENAALKTDWNGSTDDAIPYIYTDVEGSESWQNYSVSADVCFDTTMSDSITAGSFYSLFFRRTGANYYDLRLITRGGSVTLELYRYMNRTNERVLAWTTADLNAFLKAPFAGTKKATNGVVYNLKALCKDNTIYIYLDDILVGTHVETVEGAPSVGYAGMKLSKVSGSVDNFMVEEKGPHNITAIEITGVENNTFELYEGFEITPYDYTLECYDADGTVLYETLTADMISSYNNLQVGTQDITITALGYTQEATVNIKQREEYITALDTELVGLKVTELTLSDKNTVYDLAERYDELSGYEITKLSDEAIVNMAKARDKMETLVYPEIAEYDIIYSNDFNDEDSCNSEEWYDGVEVGRGEWMFTNGAYRIEQERYGIATSGWRVNKNLYAEVHSVSARMMLLSDAMCAGVAMNVGKEGYYLARVKMDVYDGNGNVIPMLQVMKNGESLYAKKISEYGVDITEYEWFTIELTLVDGIIRAYIDDKLIVSFSDSDSILYYTEGRAGICTNNGNFKFDNFVVRGVVVDEPTSSIKPIPTTYSDDFENEVVDTDPSHWVEVNTNNDWKTVKADGNTYYGTSSKDDYTYTWLHVFESNPTVSLDFMTESKSTKGLLGFFVRMAPETAYVRIGYDFSTQKWYVIETQGERDCEIYTTYSEKQHELSANKWHKLKIVAEGNRLSVVVDGAEVLSIKNVTQTGYGRIGAFADGASVYIDNVYCELPDGDHVQDGVIEYTIIPDIYNGSIELESTDENTLFGLNDGATVYSDNQGQTFELVGGTKVSEERLTSDTSLIDRFEPLTANDAYTSTMQLHDGSIVCLKQLEMVCLKSTDGAQTWNAVGRVMPEEELLDELGRRVHVIHVNSITEYQLPDGTWRIFVPVAMNLYASDSTVSTSGHYTVVYYSDDGGVTWKTSENDTRDVMIGYEEGDTSSDWAESKIVLCSDGSMRMYYTRGNIGCVSYTVSYDYGVTWGGHYNIPEMQCAKSSFSVIEDSTERGTYYFVWVNNNEVKSGSYFSRTRLSLAKSTDGMNWEFLCDLERMSEEIYGNNMHNRTPLFQIVDPSIEVTKDYIYVTFGRSDGTDPTKVVGISTSYHNAQRTRLVRIEKDKLTAREWDASTISDMLFTKTIEITEPIQTSYGLGDAFDYGGGTAVLTALDGSTKTISTSRLYMHEGEPDTYDLGTHTVTLYDAHNNSANYQINVNDILFDDDNVYTVPLGEELFLLPLDNDETASWCEYSVEMDLMISEISTITADNSAFIVLNADTNSAGGYEFGIQYTADGESCFVLRRCANDTYGTIEYMTVTSAFASSVTYNLRVKYVNGILYGYCNDKLVASYDTSEDDVMITKGTAGIRKYGMDISVVYGDFRVISEKKNTIMKEDFSYRDLSDFQDAGWNYTTKNGISLKNGTLKTDFSATNTITTSSVEGVEAWKNYIVEADVTIPYGGIQEGLAYVGISGRNDLNTNCGYDCNLYIRADNTVGARVRRLTANNTDNLTLGSVSTIGTLPEEGKIFHLKAYFFESQITFYVDDTLVYTGTDVTHTSGAAGIKIIMPNDATFATDNPIHATVDNFKVTALHEGVIETMVDQESENIPLSDYNQLTTTIFSETEDSSSEYSIEVDVTIDSAYTPSSDTPSAGIICRYSKDANNRECFYAFELRLDNSKRVMARRRIISGGGTKETVNGATIDSGLANATTYRLKVKVSGDEINFYVNGVLQDALTLKVSSLTEYQFTSGKAGNIVRTTLDEVEASPFGFANFKVVATATTATFLGDVDWDGVISNADFRNLNQQLWKGTFDNTDVNADETTDAADLVRLIKIMKHYGLG